MTPVSIRRIMKFNFFKKEKREDAIRAVDVLKSDIFKQLGFLPDVEKKEIVEYLVGVVFHGHHIHKSPTRKQK